MNREEQLERALEMACEVIAGEDCPVSLELVNWDCGNTCKSSTAKTAPFSCWKRYFMEEAGKG